METIPHTGATGGAQVWLRTQVANIVVMTGLAVRGKECLQLDRSQRSDMPQNLIRRRFLKTLPLAAGMLMDERALAQQALKTANGGSAPYPIPWLDKNGSHNQPAGPKLEPSHIYHFKGLVARCSTFTGMGTDNHGNRIGFGSPTTDY